jgi:hypothetical protein
MSRKTMMAIEHSTPMPQRSESGVSARYETKVLSFWDGEAWGEAHAFTYEIAWIPERHCWRSFQNLLSAQFCLRGLEWPCKVEA